MIIGNGAGSFAHVPAKKYGTRNGARTAEEWFGFALVADAAARLNRLVAASLLKEGVPAWTIQPSASLRTDDGTIVEGPAESVALALKRGLVPLVHGDVALDCRRGATIASTEEIFEYLADEVNAVLPSDSRWRLDRIVLAGEVDGVYTQDPQLDPMATRYQTITSSDVAGIEEGLGQSHGIDVTGGMAAKIGQSMALLNRHPTLVIYVCSGLISGAVGDILGAVEPPTVSSWGTQIRF